MTSDAIRAAAFEKYPSPLTPSTWTADRREGFIAGAEWAQKNATQPADLQELTEKEIIATYSGLWATGDINARIRSLVAKYATRSEQPAPSDVQILNAFDALLEEGAYISEWQKQAVAKCRALFAAPSAPPPDTRVSTAEKLKAEQRRLTGYAFKQNADPSCANCVLARVLDALIPFVERIDAR